MTDYQFSVILATVPMTPEEILAATDTLGNAGCTDASIRGHADGIEILFERTAESLQVAISSAIADTEALKHVQNVPGINSRHGLVSQVRIMRHFIR